MNRTRLTKLNKLMRDTSMRRDRLPECRNVRFSKSRINRHISENNESGFWYRKSVWSGLINGF